MLFLASFRNKMHVIEKGMTPSGLGFATAFGAAASEPV